MPRLAYWAYALPGAGNKKVLDAFPLNTLPRQASDCATIDDRPTMVRAAAPTISLHDFENRKHEIARELYDAATTIGFFYITGERAPWVPAAGRKPSGRHPHTSWPALALGMT